YAQTAAPARAFSDQFEGLQFRNVGPFRGGRSCAVAGVRHQPHTFYFGGTGEEPILGNVSYGDGVYKSTDGGRSWRNIGLKDSRQIARIRIHPDNPDV